MQKYYFILFIILGLNACTKESSENFTDNEYFVNSEIQTYFDRFEAEGKKRGLEIDLEAAGISGDIQEIEKDKVLGQCFSSSDEPSRLIIDATFWKQAKDLQKEFVVFHELGHCYLNRSHNNESNNGKCVSMMQSGTTGCRFNYTNFTRTAYLDELFNN